MYLLKLRNSLIKIIATFFSGSYDFYTAKNLEFLDFGNRVTARVSSKMTVWFATLTWNEKNSIFNEIKMICDSNE